MQASFPSSPSFDSASAVAGACMTLIIGVCVYVGWLVLTFICKHALFRRAPSEGAVCKLSLREQILQMAKSPARFVTICQSKQW